MLATASKPTSTSTSAANGWDWEEDSTMKKLRERKRNAEEAELYNKEETMALKREAVKSAAMRTPPLKITKQNATSWKRRCQHRGVDEGSVQFDDDISANRGEQMETSPVALISPNNTTATAKAKRKQRKSQQERRASALIKTETPDPPPPPLPVLAHTGSKSKRAIKRSRQVASRRIRRIESQLASQLHAD